MATLAELLRQGADKLVNLPSEAQRFITNPQAFTQLLTGKNPLPRETGFAAGATGLPAQEMSVLDPNQAPYMQGYSQGEPIGYAGMAAPFAAPAAVATAKALAPKAGMMAENYMVKQGMIQPLTAYHGTPHTIQGQFDINKVGTGEGNQTFGHGMYFAENPKVAEGYRDALSVDPNVASEKLQFKTLETFMPTEKKAVQGEIQAFIDGTGNYNNFVRVINQEGSDAFKKALLKEEPNLFNAGNLYKVDIPDEYIPMMLDYDKPLLQQPPNVLKALQSIDDPYIQQAITTKPKLSKDGEYWEYMGNTYASKSEALEDATPQRIISGYTGLGKNPQEVSQALGQYGIKGVKYLDQSSRVEGKGTSNFVVFEPSQVKILEKNDKPVTRKDLIEKQVKALKE
jgi:hypothetical protein